MLRALKILVIGKFIKENFVVELDGHSILVTPDPVPNSEVKLDVFVLVLSMMGRYGAVYFFISAFFSVEKIIGKVLQNFRLPNFSRDMHPH